MQLKRLEFCKTDELVFAKFQAFKLHFVLLKCNLNAWNFANTNSSVLQFQFNVTSPLILENFRHEIVDALQDFIEKTSKFNKNNITYVIVFRKSDADSDTNSENSDNTTLKYVNVFLQSKNAISLQNGIADFYENIRNSSFTIAVKYDCSLTYCKDLQCQEKHWTLVLPAYRYSSFLSI